MRVMNSLGPRLQNLIASPLPVVPKTQSTASKNIFIFLPIPRDSRLTDGVLNGSTCSDPAFSASNLGLDDPLPGLFTLSSAARVEKAEVDVGESLDGLSGPQRRAVRESGVGGWLWTRESRRVPLSGRRRSCVGEDIFVMERGFDDGKQKTGRLVFEYILSDLESEWGLIFYTLTQTLVSKCAHPPLVLGPEPGGPLSS